jgi:hypothetical protein
MKNYNKTLGVPLTLSGRGRVSWGLSHSPFPSKASGKGYYHDSHGGREPVFGIPEGSAKTIAFIPFRAISSVPANAKVKKDDIVEFDFNDTFDSAASEKLLNQAPPAFDELVDG